MWSVAEVPQYGLRGEVEPGHPGLANPELTARVGQLVALAISPLTRRTYSTSESHYLQFCAQHQRKALPGSDVVLSYYALSLTQTLSSASVRTYMATVCNLHLELGLDYPDAPTSLLHRVMRGVAWVGSTRRTRLPITMPLYEQSVSTWQIHSSEHPKTEPCWWQHFRWRSTASCSVARSRQIYCCNMSRSAQTAGCRLSIYQGCRQTQTAKVLTSW